jgi:hypothetical protein
VLFPRVLKKIKDLELAERILDSNNFPADLIYSDEEVAEIEAQEAQQLAQQQAQEAMVQAADAYPKINEPVEEGSPAAAIGEVIGA